ncbi:inorganic diphosphatase [Candidatus Blochmannia vicinus (nom. nud.)]|uniref:Inorganic pyrophosphatase n=1 Tax=Candidatus Blochmannia vicinus (nom. nud.) TaxID=251540 RepID=A0A9Q8TVL8_9ENTR|nr:inorganic diphosphatase [Candidatus Blochmannia vicinus]URJ28083.1 inorganic diphosphatase [Candidatus Blochmannia vicinus]URJ30644.1 inorganic diphosphatase [Candidatus Blochmannia vicinus]
MYFNQVPAGRNIPEDIYVIIEIPANSDPIKYEIDKKTGMLFVDRFLLTPTFYPCNYGYINQTLSLDGDPMDVLVSTPYPLQSGCVIHCRPIGMLNMVDESGNDAKIIAVPHEKISEQYSLIQDINDLPNLLRNQINHFFKNYKDLDSGKWVKIKNWESSNAAKTEILKAFERFKKIT